MIVVVVAVVMMMFALVFSAHADVPQPIPTPIVIAPPAAAPQEGVLSETAAQAAQADAINYWTRERLAAAQPADLLIDPAAAAVDTAAADASEALRTPGASLAGLPSAGADAVARQAYAQDWAALDAAASSLDTLGVLQADSTTAIDSPTGTSQVFTRYQGNYNSAFWTTYPYRTIGKFFSSAGSCTASSASGNNIVVTAAHCVYDTANNVFYTGKAFTPAYRNGSAPYGTFPTSQCFVLTNWVNLSGSFSINGWTKYDVAVCKMGNNTAGQSLSSAVGWLGRSWDWGYVQNHHSFGYASNITSYYTSICTAETFYQTTDTLGMGCDMTYGASGGPGIRVFAPFQIGAMNYVNTVQSGIYVGTPNIYGARFSSNNIVPLCNAAGC
jgi:V8-like Glu-specific endopeptidase